MKVIFPATFLEGEIVVNLFFEDKESLGFLQMHYLLVTVCCLTSFTLCSLSSLCATFIGSKTNMSAPGFLTLRARDGLVCLDFLLTN